MDVAKAENLSEETEDEAVYDDQSDKDEFRTSDQGGGGGFASFAMEPVDPNETGRALLPQENPHESERSYLYRQGTIKAEKPEDLIKAEQEFVDMVRKRWYIIPRNSKFVSRWENIVMTLAIYNCCWTPLTVSFDWAVKVEETSTFLAVLDISIMAIYTVDIVVQFMTSYYNVFTGDEVF